MMQAPAQPIRGNLPIDPSSNRITRVLQVINCLDVGGAEKRLLDITRHVGGNRIEMHYCTLSGQVGALDGDFRNAGAKIHPIKLGMRFPWEFKNLLRQYQFHVVHAHMHYSAGFVLRLAAQVATPVRIAHFRSCSDGRGNNLRRHLQRWLMRRWICLHATHVLACGESAMVSNWGFEWQNDARFRVIPNGLDPTPFKRPAEREAVCREFGLSVQSPLFIHVGNLRLPKNHRKLLAVFGKILEKEPAANLLLVGRGENDIENELRHFVVRRGIAERVIFAGVRHDVPRLLQAADAMIFPSLWEGLPGAVLEACAAGIPVLASDLPEIREVSAHLPLVQCLSLDGADDRWAEEALKFCGRHETRDRQLSTAQFSASPFHIQACVRAHMEVWEQTDKAPHEKIIKRAA